MFSEISEIQKRAPGSSQEALQQFNINEDFEKLSCFQFCCIFSFQRKNAKTEEGEVHRTPPDRSRRTSGHPDTIVFLENFDLRRTRAKRLEMQNPAEGEAQDVVRFGEVVVRRG